MPAESRASLLRSALQQADSFAQDARVVLDGQMTDLATLQETVSQITLPAQVSRMLWLELSRAKGTHIR